MHHFEHPTLCFAMNASRSILASLTEQIIVVGAYPVSLLTIMAEACCTTQSPLTRGKIHWLVIIIGSETLDFVWCTTHDVLTLLSSQHFQYTTNLFFDSSQCSNYLLQLWFHSQVYGHPHFTPYSSLHLAGHKVHQKHFGRYQFGLHSSSQDCCLWFYHRVLHLCSPNLLQLGGGKVMVLVGNY